MRLSSLAVVELIRAVGLCLAAVLVTTSVLSTIERTPLGPHRQSMYQIAFPPPLLAVFLPWLMLNRDGLSILLHPGTGDAYADHIDHAVWLSSVLPPSHS